MMEWEGIVLIGALHRGLEGTGARIVGRALRWRGEAGAKDWIGPD